MPAGHKDAAIDAFDSIRGMYEAVSEWSPDDIVSENFYANTGVELEFVSIKKAAGGHHWVPQSVTEKWASNGQLGDGVEEFWQRFTFTPSHTTHNGGDNWYVNGTKYSHKKYNYHVRKIGDAYLAKAGTFDLETAQDFAAWLQTWM